MLPLRKSDKMCFSTMPMCPHICVYSYVPILPWFCFIYEAAVSLGVFSPSGETESAVSHVLTLPVLITVFKWNLPACDYDMGCCVCKILGIQVVKLALKGLF